jgi:hypothetical protein
MYNGYVEGTFDNYDLVTVSFTTIIGKEGNVFLNQQLMPMVTSMLIKNKNFLIDDRVKKICILTTHKSTKMNPEENKTERDSSIQMSVKFANMLGFEFIEIFPIKNLNINGRYRDISEIIENTRLIQKRKKDNFQYEQVKLKDGKIIASFGKKPKGQEQKFFAMKMMAIAHLTKGNDIDISQALIETSDRTIQVLNEYIDYLKTIKPQNYSIFKDVLETDFNIEEIEELEEIEDIELPITIAHNLEHKTRPVTAYNQYGKKIYKTQKIFKIKSFKIHYYQCACHDEKHFYFISNASKKNYVEGHHLIPMEYQHQYWSELKRNLDCTINIVPLCPNCHSKIHKATSRGKLEIISELYQKYKKQLLTIDPDMTLEKFASLYNVYIY